MVTRLQVAIVAKGDPGSGNLSSAARIQKAIGANESSAECHFLPLGKSSEEALLHDLLSRKPHVVLALHLRRCSFLSKLSPSIPILLICGGTDLNEDVNNPEAVRLMSDLIRRSRGVVVFSRSMAIQYLSVFGQLDKNIPLWTIPQGIELSPMPEGEEVHSLLGLPSTQRFFVVIGRLRKVKDPCFCIRPFYEWNEERNDEKFVLLFVGAVETSGEEKCNDFLREVSRYSPTVRHMDGLLAGDCQLVMRASVALINSSRSEGQSVAILEAMAMGTPVLARAIPGNCDLITHEETGLLFKDVEDLKDGLSRLADQPGLRQDLTQKAKMMISENHCSVKEGVRYSEAIHLILDS